MSNEEGVALDGDDGLVPPRRRSTKEKVEAAAEWSWTKASARLSMIIVAPLFLIVAYFGERTLQQIDSRLDHLAGQQEEQGDQLEQIGINQAQGKIERDDQARAIQEIKDGMIRIWDRVTGRKN